MKTSVMILNNDLEQTLLGIYRYQMNIYIPSPNPSYSIHNSQLDRTDLHFELVSFYLK